MLYKVVLTFKSLDEIFRDNRIPIKALPEDYHPEVALMFQYFAKE